MKACGISDANTLQVLRKIRGGGKHKDKKGRAEKKHVAGQASESDRGPAIRECNKH